MDRCDSLKLRKNWPLLLDIVNSDDVTPYLIKDLVLEPVVVEGINAETTKKEKTTALLTRLLEAGPGAYSSFRKALAQHNVYSKVISKLDNTDVETQAPLPLSGVDKRDSKDVPVNLMSTISLDEPVQPIAAQSDEIPVSKEPFSDRECHLLAKLLGPGDLNSVGLELDFLDADLKRYQLENRRGDGGFGGTYNMLVDWKKNCFKSEQREKLSGALRRAGHHNFAHTVRYGYKLDPSPD